MILGIPLLIGRIVVHRFIGKIFLMAFNEMIFQMNVPDPDDIAASSIERLEVKVDLQAICVDSPSWLSIEPRVSELRT